MLYHLEVSDINLEDHEGENVYRLMRPIRSAGAGRCKKVGLPAVNDRTDYVEIWKRFRLNWNNCIFHDIDEHIEMTKDIRKTHPNVFLSTNLGKQTKLGNQIFSKGRI